VILLTMGFKLQSTKTVVYIMVVNAKLAKKFKSLNFDSNTKDQSMSLFGVKMPLLVFKITLSLKRLVLSFFSCKIVK